MITWTKATTPPDPTTACLLASSNLNGDNWAFNLGFYLPKDYIFTKPNGKVIVMIRSGYFIYNQETEELQAVMNVKYWSSINKPADILDELIIMEEN